MKLSVIIPVYNEHALIDRVVAAVRAVALPAPFDALEIVLVDDGSSDGTTAAVARYRGAEGFQVHIAPFNRGKGAAVRAGLHAVTGDVVIIQDADLEYEPGDYPALLAPIGCGETNVVYGSRFMGQQQVAGMRLPYRLANVILRTLTNVLYGGHLTDEATAYKVVRTELLRALELTAVRFEICPEITAKLLRRGERIVEVPISYRGRTREEGKKICLRDAFEAVWTLVRLRVTR